MSLTLEQFELLSRIEEDTTKLVLNGVTNSKEIAERMAIKYFEGDESDEMISMIGDVIMLTKYSLLN